MRRLLVATATAALVCGACQGPGARLNAPPHGGADRTSRLQSTMVYMVDNAMLEDMTISDAHFVPHRTMLNSLGEDRLARFASLIEVYGGPVRFNTDLQDEELIDARTTSIVDYLGECGVDTYAEAVVLDHPGGTGMKSREAILIRQHEATYQPKKKSGATGTTGSGATSVK